MEVAPNTSFIQGDFVSLVKRHIAEDTCRKWGYHTGEYSGRPCQVANYRNDRGRVVAQKVRFADKSFTILGDAKAMGLYGKHLWSEGGRMIVVTEGELDALSVSQLQGNRWPVVSVPNGAQSAHKHIAAELDYLSSFDKVVLMFDNDDPGRAAAERCAELFTPGKVAIATLPLKDANEMLQANRGKEVIEAMWNAKVYRPDGLVLGSELWDTVSTFDAKSSVPYPWDAFNKVTHGIRKGELVIVTAGTGIGKSAISREIAYSILQRDIKVGYIALEESVRHTALSLMGLHLCQRVELHHVYETVSKDALRQAFDATMGTDNLVLYDHFGSMEEDRLLNKIRQMAKGFGCGFIFLDHISIAVSEFADGDERRRIDALMTKLRRLAQELEVGIIAVSHLKRPDGRALEEGGQVSLALLRGSGSIGQLTDICLGAERDQQGDTPNLTKVRVLKNRYTGETGVAGYLEYDGKTGRLTEAEAPQEEAKNDYGF